MASARPIKRPTRHPGTSTRVSASGDVDILWQGMTFARDSKALLMVRNRKVLKANELACELLGRSLPDLIGMKIDRLVEGNVSRCKVSSVWETTLIFPGTIVPVEITCARLISAKNVSVVAIRDLRFRDKARHDRQSHGLALKERDRELRAQREVLETALKSLSQGFCVFDHTQRLAICNETYLKLYGLTPEEARPGTHVRDILRHRIARGIYSGPSPDAFVEERLSIVSAHEPVAVTHRFPDGRIVEVGHHPMPGGGGSLPTAT